MPCQTQCPSRRKLRKDLVRGIEESNAPYIPESSERALEEYCETCIFDRTIGRGYRRKRQDLLLG